MMQRLLATVMITLLMGMNMTANAQDDDSKRDENHPAIAQFGAIQPRKHVADQPEADKHYKVVFDITNEIESADKPHPGLDHVARAVNVFASAGVPLDHLHFVAVVHGPATAAVLDDKAYKKELGHDNPNTPLLKGLQKAGVKVKVCSQALAENDYDSETVNDSVETVLSALSSLAIYGNRGYAYEKL